MLQDIILNPLRPVAHRADLCRAFKMLHFIRSPVLSLSHPFQVAHSQEPHSCYQTPSGCLVPLVTVQSNLGATVTNQDWVQGRQFPLRSCISRASTQCKWNTRHCGSGEEARELKTGLIHYSSLGKKCCWLTSTGVWAIHWSCPPMS